MSDYPHIEERSERFYVKGKRVSIITLAYVWDQGASPEAIAQKFSALTYAEIYAAIAFYLDHQELINQQAAEDDAEFEAARLAQRTANPAFFADMEQRIAVLRAREATSVS